MAYTTIDKPSDYFNTITYSGDGSSPVSVTGVGFQPDWVWVKRRNGTTPHVTYDVVRGTGEQLIPNDTSAESTNNQYGYISAFEADGFEATAGSTSITRIYGSGGTYVAWNWLAGGTAVSNTDGSITSSVSANTTSGFSIVSWTGNGTNGASVGHSLSQAPEMIVVKNRTDVTDWRVGQTVAGNIMTSGNGYYMEWNDNKASTNPGSATLWGSPPLAPTSSVFYVGSSNVHNGSGDDMLCYCFHSVKGFSKIGSYTGNGSTDGTFVYTGFRPAFLITKDTSTAGTWIMYDSVRDTDNLTTNRLFTDTTGTEVTTTAVGIDLLSNGFKIRNTNSQQNTSGNKYIYMCFAENPFVTSTGVPTTAR